MNLFKGYEKLVDSYINWRANTFNVSEQKAADETDLISALAGVVGISAAALLAIYAFNILAPEQQNAVMNSRLDNKNQEIIQPTLPNTGAGNYHLNDIV
ncbi:MAG: hypothetical protein GXP63_06975 [DPANN group archaeon]|nr:hypothetical protein [DPANN group archaeon]